MNPLNTSGMGKKSDIPREIRGWNWGAFFLSWIWGFRNKTYIALLMFIPVVNLVMPFVLGAKGNVWAWQNCIWRDVEHFKKSQRRWSIAGLLILLLLISLPFVISMFGLKGEVYDMSFDAISSNTEAQQYLGDPITDGYFVNGNISMENGAGSADLEYSVSGSQHDAEANVIATRQDGNWILNRVIVIDRENNKIINIIE